MKNKDFIYLLWLLIGISAFSISKSSAQSYKSATGIDYDSLGHNPTTAPIGDDIRTFFKMQSGDTSHPHLYGQWRGRIFRIDSASSSGGAGFDSTEFWWQLVSGAHDSVSIIFKQGFAILYTKTGDTLAIGVDSTAIITSTYFTNHQFKASASGYSQLTDSARVGSTDGSIAITQTGHYINFGIPVEINTGNFCDGSDGDTSIAPNTTITLSRDMCWDTVYGHSNSAINANGYKIYATAIIVQDSVVNTFLIFNNGGAGGAGANGIEDGTSGTGDGGTAGAAAGTGSTTAMPAGALGGTDGHTSGFSGNSVTNAIGSNGANGATGGAASLDDFDNTSTAAGNAGTGGTATALAASAGNPRVFPSLTQAKHNGTALTINGGSGGSGCGGVGAAAGGVNGHFAGGGGGGGSGGNGGWLIVQTKFVYGAVYFQAKGGSGGNGGNGQDAVIFGGRCSGAGGGGGAGQGGGGGCVVFVYHSSGNWSTSQISAAAGSQGSPGNGGAGRGGCGGLHSSVSAGNPGGSPPSGLNGLTFIFKI